VLTSELTDDDLTVRRDTVTVSPFGCCALLEFIFGTPFPESLTICRYKILTNFPGSFVFSCKLSGFLSDFYNFSGFL